MRELSKIDQPCLVICHFRNEEAVEKAGGRLIRYQVSITLEDKQLSPRGDYIRFGGDGDEIVGWQPCDNIVIDEVLEYLELSTTSDDRIEDAA